MDFFEQKQTLTRYFDELHILENKPQEETHYYLLGVENLIPANTEFELSALQEASSQEEAASAPPQYRVELLDQIKFDLNADLFDDL